MHNFGVVEFITDHVAVMQDGRIGESGVADAVLRYPRSPYTKTLPVAVPRIVPVAIAGSAAHSGMTIGPRHHGS